MCHPGILDLVLSGRFKNIEAVVWVGYSGSWFLRVVGFAAPAKNFQPLGTANAHDGSGDTSSEGTAQPDEEPEDSPALQSTEPPALPRGAVLWSLLIGVSISAIRLLFFCHVS